MGPDEFAGNSAALIVSWLCAVVTLVVICSAIAQLTVGQRGWKLALVVWTVVSLLLVAKLINYVIWILLIAGSYPWQSFGAFGSVLLLALYVPIVSCLLILIGFATPIVTMTMLLDQEKMKPVWAFVIAIPVIPIASLLGSFLFFLALPVATQTIGWLNPKDIIKASNGPAEIWWRYVVNPMNSPSDANLNPAIVDLTPGTHKDVMRLHIAHTYFNNANQAWFLQRQYPRVYSHLLNVTEP